jgi:CelD/BcsL family acetyltransferase involved in cellulose biosynthesis
MLALKLLPVLEVVEVTDYTAFMALAEEWNALVTATCDEPFYRHEFIRIWIENFAPEARLKILTGRDRQGKLTAVLPLMEERGSLYGFPVKQLCATGNAHSCRFDLIAEDPEIAGGIFFEHLKGDKSWYMLQIMDVPYGGNAWYLYHAAERAGFPVGIWESQQSPYIPLRSSYEEIFSGLSSKLRANIRRRRKNLEEIGSVSVERVTGGSNIREYLEVGYKIEKSGWKGEQGTAIAQKNGTYGFYTRLADAASSSNYLSLYYLKLDNRAIAFHYGFTYGGVYYLLKPGYDETFKSYSPGVLLLEEVLKDCISRDLREFDFLGPNMRWKQDWTSKVRPHNWLFIFRNSSYGNALYKAKFKLAPVARQVLERWKKNDG